MTDNKNTKAQENAQHAPATNAEVQTNAPEIIPSDLDSYDQASASACVAQPLSLLDLPSKADPEDKTAAIDVLKELGILDNDGLPTPDFSKEISHLSENSAQELRARLKKQVLLRTLATAGIIPTYIDENRDIHASNLDQLEENLDEREETIFDEPAKVVWATKVLEEGKPLKTFDGKEVTKDTIGVEKFITILDAQHRTVCCIERPDLDLWVEFVEFTGTSMDYVGRLNNVRKSWNGDDIRHSVMVKHKGLVTVLEEIERFKDSFGVTFKYAEIALTRKKDQFKRDELNELQQGKDPSAIAKYSFNPLLNEVGWKIMESTMMSFIDKKQLKKVKKIEYMEAIFNILEYLEDDSAKADFELNIATFIGKLDATQMTNIVAYIDTPKDLNSYLYKQYKNFVNSHPEDIEELRLDNQKALASRKTNAEAEEQKSTTVKKLKIGSPSEIIQNRKALERQKAVKDAKKNATTSKSNSPNSK